MNIGLKPDDVLAQAQNNVATLAGDLLGETRAVIDNLANDNAALRIQVEELITENKLLRDVADASVEGLHGYDGLVDALAALDAYDKAKAKAKAK